jgi:hypothetical protein
VQWAFEVANKLSLSSAVRFDNRLDMTAAHELVATFWAPLYRARHVMDMPTAVLDITVMAAFPFIVRGGVSCVDHVVDAYRIHGTRVG